MPELDRGFDLGQLDEVSPEEAAAFREFYRARYGLSHPGLNFWIDEGRPDVVKRYRRFAERVTSGPPGEGVLGSFPWCLYYPSIGFEAYIPRQVHMLQESGFSRSQIVELYAVMFLVAGPRGAETVARALRDYEWKQPAAPPPFPDGWGFDPAAFISGVDFSSPEVAPGEVELIEAWYERVEGEVPAYVRFLGSHRPDVLKAYRSRFENLLHELPKQVVPSMLLHHAVVNGHPAAARENVLLARGFAMSKAQTLHVVVLTGLYGVAEPVSSIAAAAGDVFDAWEDP